MREPHFRRHLMAATAFACTTFLTTAYPQTDPDHKDKHGATVDETSRTISPVRGIRRSDRHRETEGLNDAHQPLRRLFAPDYADGRDELAGSHRPSPRQISNVVFSQYQSLPNPNNATDYLWQWGQFIDHDIDLTDGANPPEPFPIAVPIGDPLFDPAGTGSVSIDFNRSIYEHDADGVRQQINEITGWIDASHVYGSDVARTQALRTLDGSGRLKTSDGNLLPFNTEGLPNAGGDSDQLFLAGDVRANEQVGLTVMHTLFVREHNRQATRYAQRNNDASGDEIFAAARRMVTAQMQHITFTEFLPALLGSGNVPAYEGLRRNTDPRISNAFSTSAFRLGHSLLSPQILRLGADGQATENGPLALRDAFFQPQLVQDEGIEPILRGLAAQVCQTVDARVIDAVRNFLFGPPGAGGFDLVALNIQRGRDHGLPSYNAARAQLGLPIASSFEDVSSNPVTVERLRNAYDSVNDIDLWVGSLAEDPLQGSMLGELNQQIVLTQFLALRDGDPNWYERTLNRKQLDSIRKTTLADVIRANTSIDAELANNVFRLDRHGKRKRSGDRR